MKLPDRQVHNCTHGDRTACLNHAFEQHVKISAFKTKTAYNQFWTLFQKQQLSAFILKPALQHLVPQLHSQNHFLVKQCKIFHITTYS